ncbi:MAG TPA: DUF1028 domain-containing protein [Trueperaceae bacterium]|nr:DUF1028 domain-containing protein [Trueperaceae bacterium]
MNPNPNIATFSIVARDSETGDLGVAVASKFLAVGAYVPYARAGVGAVASQAYGNSTYGPRALDRLAAGGSPADCAAEFAAEDAYYESRQFGIVAADGTSYTHTGKACHAWAGGIAGPDFSAQGNILTGPDVVDAMVTSLHADGLAFPERLLAALTAADQAGGDSRGRQSAAILVVGTAKGYLGLTDKWIDLRVDDHAQPVEELSRLLAMHRLFFAKPSTTPRVLSSDDIRWLQDVLHRDGFAALGSSGTWDDATESALEALFGVENLEERWLSGPRMDPVAWEHLRRVRP